MKKSRIRVIKKTRRKLIVNSISCVFLVAVLGYFSSEYEILQKILFVKNEIAGAEDQAFSARGVVYDRYYTPIAETKTKVSVYCRSREVDDPEAFITAVNEIVPVNVTRLRTQFDSGELRIWLADGIHEQQEKLLHESGLKGLFFTHQSERSYPQKELTAHLVGVVDEDVGVSGVEYYFDKLLTGTVDRGYTKIAGVQDLVLTLDLKIQKSLYSLLLRIAEGSNVERIAGYVVDTKTGALVGGAQWPSYDPHNYSDYSPKVHESLFLQNIPIPIGLQRLFTTTACLLDKAERGTEVPWSVASPAGNIGSELRLWGQLGLDDLSTPDFAAIAQYKRNASTYTPLLRPIEGSSLPNLITPLQMLMGLAHVAHGEGRIRPHVVEKVLSRESHEEVFLQDKRLELEEGYDFLKNGAEVKQFIQSSASGYGGGNYMLQYFQKVANNEGEIFGQELLFSFVPTPQADLGMLLVVERNSHVTGAPDAELTRVVQNMLSRIAALQQIAAVMGETLKIPMASANEYLTENQAKQRTESKPQKRFSTEPMPDLIGLSLRKSLGLLERYNCNIQVEGTGWVSSQYPPKGASMKDVHTCRVSLQDPEMLRSQKKILKR